MELLIDVADIAYSISVLANIFRSVIAHERVIYAESTTANG